MFGGVIVIFLEPEMACLESRQIFVKSLPGGRTGWDGLVESNWVAGAYVTCPLLFSSDLSSTSRPTSSNYQYHRVDTF